jgi:AmmeMemoRadiSam system protein A/AmmeMemoRadiSam system protein B
MNYLSGAYLLPHPPIIVPEVGRGEERKIKNTSEAFRRIADEIKETKPETIIVITPHGTMFNEAIAVSFDQRISGDLSQFRAGNVVLEKEIDLELTEEICLQAERNNLPVIQVNARILRNYHRPFILDHGALVPLYFVEESYTDYKLVHITYGLLRDADLYRFGMLLSEGIGKLKRRTAIIASGDLSHRLTKDGPYPYSPQGRVFDQTLLELLQKGDTLGVFHLDKELIEEAGQCGYNSLLILLGALRGEFTGELLSYEGPFGVGYGVMKFHPQKPKRDYLSLLSKKEKKRGGDAFVRLARASIEHFFQHNHTLKVPKDLPEELLKKRAGVFVSLKKFGRLRGCIGTFLPTRSSVAEEIIHNALEAAFQDPRFNPLLAAELEDLEISVDVLSEPVPTTKEELNPKKYGIIVTQNYRRGLLLPDLEGVDTVAAQIDIACQKAGISPNSKFTIEKFTVERHREE